MNRRIFVRSSLTVVSLGLLAGCGDGLPRPVKVPRIGYLSGESATAEPQGREAVLQGLQDLGYVEGQNITIDYRFTGGRPERAPQLARELVALKPDALLAFAGTQVTAAMQATTSIPIIIHTGDPVTGGFVSSLSRPGRNVTGVSISGPEINSKKLDLLKQAVPSIARVAYLSTSDPPSPSARLMIDQAPRLGVQVQVLLARGPDDLPNAFASAVAGQPGALIVPDDPWIFTYRAQIIAFAAQQRLPAIYGRREYVEDGGLLSYGQNILASRRRLAVYVDKILRGANPAEVPVEQPTTFELAVNQTTVQGLGLTLPASFAAQVTQWVP
jgi:putative ABC transport system substrate-binding protein